MYSNQIKFLTSTTNKAYSINYEHIVRNAIHLDLPR